MSGSLSMQHLPDTVILGNEFVPSAMHEHQSVATVTGCLLRAHPRALAPLRPPRSAAAPSFSTCTVQRHPIG